MGFFLCVCVWFFDASCFFTSSSPQMGGAVNLLHGWGLRFFMQPPLHHHHHHHHHEPVVIKIPKPHHSPVRDWIKATRLLCSQCNHLPCIHAGDRTSFTFFWWLLRTVVFFFFLFSLNNRSGFAVSITGAGEKVFMADRHLHRHLHHHHHQHHHPALRF